jgi:hypothetical protein
LNANLKVGVERGLRNILQNPNSLVKQRLPLLNTKKRLTFLGYIGSMINSGISKIQFEAFWWRNDFENRVTLALKNYKIAPY